MTDIELALVILIFCTPILVGLLCIFDSDLFWNCLENLKNKKSKEVNRMTKKDLKNGMVLVNRKGNDRLYVDGALYNHEDYLSIKDDTYRRVNSIDNYNDDLTNANDHGNLDIVKVMYDGKVLWQRPAYVLSDNDKALLKGLDSKWKYVVKNSMDEIVFADKPLVKNGTIFGYTAYSTYSYSPANIIKFSKTTNLLTFIKNGDDVVSVDDLRKLI